MSETAQLIALLQQQLEAQKKQIEALAEAQRKQTEALMAVLTREADRLPAIPSFPQQRFQFRFRAFRLNSGNSGYILLGTILTFQGGKFGPQEKETRIPDEPVANHLQTSQQPSFSTVTTRQRQRPESGTEIIVHEGAVRPQAPRYVVRERFKFWSEMRRKPGETIQELAARIRQDAVTCDFPRIKDPLDEALAPFSLARWATRQSSRLFSR